MAHEWLTEQLEPILQSVPTELRAKLEPAEVAVLAMESMGPLANPFDPSQGFIDEEYEKPHDPWEDEAADSEAEGSQPRLIWTLPPYEPEPRSNLLPKQ